jgi:uncharacterized protein
MDMTGKEQIKAPKERVWAALNDADVLRRCVPGCQALENVGPNQLAAVVKLKVGVVSATFMGEIEITNVDAPNSYTISGSGKGGIAGFAKGSAEVRLAEQDGETLLSYTCSAQVGGKIAQVGSRIIDSTAKKLATQFFGTFNQLVSQPVTAP